MLTIKVEMNPEKEAALRKLVAKHGGPLNGYLLPYLNMIADGTLMLVPEIGPSTTRGTNWAAYDPSVTK